MNEKPTYEELEQRVNLLEQADSDRKRAEKALLEIEERYNQVIEHSLTGVYIHIGGLLKFANKRLAGMMGYVPKEMVGRQYWEFVHPEDREMVKNISLARARGEAVPSDYEFRHQSKTGEVVWVHNLPTIIQYEGQTANMGNLVQINDRKWAEEKLKESDERYRGLFERSLDMVYLCDFEGNFIDANEAALKGLGYTKKEIKSLTFLSLMDKDQLPRASEAVAEILKTGSQKNTAEFQLKRKDGEHIYIESKGALIYRDGKPFAIQGVVRNVTERKKLEEEKEKLIYELKQALKEVKQLGGLLPICSHCKKIRDDKGYWNQMEAYIENHSEAEFSHSICQECAKKYYPDMDIYGEDETQQ